MPQEPSVSASAPIPMNPLSSPVVLPDATTSLSSHSAVTSSTTAFVSKTSLVITIVTTEQVPNTSKGSTATTTIERELKMRLSLPQCYDTQQLKSLNVRLHQEPTNNAVYPSFQPNPYGNYCTTGCEPSSLTPSHSSKAQQQQWHQEQLRLFQEDSSHHLLPEPVSSSLNNEINSPDSTLDSSFLRPDTVSSSSTEDQGAKRRRTRNSTLTSTTQSSSRKKRKLMNNKTKNLTQ